MVGHSYAVKIKISKLKQNAWCLEMWISAHALSISRSINIPLIIMFCIAIRKSMEMIWNGEVVWIPKKKNTINNHFLQKKTKTKTIQGFYFWRKPITVGKTYGHFDINVKWSPMYEIVFITMLLLYHNYMRIGSDWNVSYHMYTKYFGRQHVK